MGPQRGGYGGGRRHPTPGPHHRVEVRAGAALQPMRGPIQQVGVVEHGQGRGGVRRLEQDSERVEEVGPSQRAAGGPVGSSALSPTKAGATMPGAGNQSPHRTKAIRSATPARVMSMDAFASSATIFLVMFPIRVPLCLPGGDTSTNTTMSDLDLSLARAEAHLATFSRNVDEIDAVASTAIRNPSGRIHTASAARLEVFSTDWLSPNRSGQPPSCSPKTFPIWQSSGGGWPGSLGDPDLIERAAGRSLRAIATDLTAEAVPTDRAVPEHARPMAPYYANAKRVERGACWRMVSRDDGYRKGSPTGCPDPVRWTGNAVIGKERYQLDSCEGQADELENVRRLTHSKATGVGSRTGPSTGPIRPAPRP